MAWVQQWKEIAEAAQSTVTVLGVLVGAWWTYSLFVRKREPYPKANVQHRITHWHIADRVLLHLTVRITNVSVVVLAIPSLLVRVQQLLPMTAETVEQLAACLPAGESEFPWPLLAERSCDWSAEKREVEPGETEECHFDFLLPAEVVAVSVYSYVKNQSKSHREVGWNTTTVYSCRLGGLDDSEETNDADRTRASREDAVTSTSTEAAGKVGVAYGEVHNKDHHT
jgi:hypothetical protein